jgi:tRNA threonylcarbamoyladenosine biosynthesis protein TsaE
MELKQTITKEDIPAIVAVVLDACRVRMSDAAVVIALHGDLGAGKTTFVQALGRALGVAEQITSPTFTIMKGYETTDTDFTHLIHMDAYRIDDSTELGPLRFSEVLAAPQTLFCIEWAERIVEALPQNLIQIYLTVATEDTRNIRISSS